MKLSGDKDCQYILSNVYINVLELIDSEILACVWERDRQTDDRERERERERKRERKRMKYHIIR